MTHPARRPTAVSRITHGKAIVSRSAEAAERAFDPFYTTRPEGTGLGLATVHRIVHDHGGLVRLDRECDPWSTVVRVRLPRAEAS